VKDLRTIGFFLLCAANLARPALASGAMDALYTALQGKDQCVSFTWEQGDGEEGRKGIDVPLTLDGQQKSFRLDTSSDVSTVWGSPPGHDGQSSYNAGNIQIGSSVISHPLLAIGSGGQNEDGMLGLQTLVGWITVIDYADEKFCLFQAADVPPEVMAANWTDAELRGLKLMLPIAMNGLSGKDIIFDTGASDIDLEVDFDIWKSLTGIEDTEQAPIQDTILGTSIPMIAAPAQGSMTIAGVTEDSTEVFTVPDTPNQYAQTYGAGGVTGNKPFWDGAVVMDLSTAKTFNYVFTTELQIKLGWPQHARFGVIE